MQGFNIRIDTYIILIAPVVLLFLSFILRLPMVANSTEILNCIPVVLAGYDVIEYFNLSTSAINQFNCNPTMGNSSHYYNLESFDHNHKSRLYQFWFSTQTNLQLFASNPWKYVPKYGGFSAYGTCCQTQGYPWNATHLGPPSTYVYVMYICLSVIKILYLIANVSPI